MTFYLIGRDAPTKGAWFRTLYSWEKYENEREKAKNISYVEASFRNDLYNHVDTKEDKIKDLIEKANLAHKPILEYRVEPKEEEKTSKDHAAENIINYTDTAWVFLSFWKCVST